MNKLFQHILLSTITLSFFISLNTQSMEKDTQKPTSIDINNPQEVNDLWLEIAHFMTKQNCWRPAGNHMLNKNSNPYQDSELPDLNPPKELPLHSFDTLSGQVQALQLAQNFVSQNQEINIVLVTCATILLTNTTAQIDQEACALLHSIITSGKSTQIPRETFFAIIFMHYLGKQAKNYTDETKNMITEMMNLFLQKRRK